MVLQVAIFLQCPASSIPRGAGAFHTHPTGNGAIGAVRNLYAGQVPIREHFRDILEQPIVPGVASGQHL